MNMTTLFCVIGGHPSGLHIVGCRALTSPSGMGPYRWPGLLMKANVHVQAIFLNQGRRVSSATGTGYMISSHGGPSRTVLTESPISGALSDVFSDLPLLGVRVLLRRRRTFVLFRTRGAAISALARFLGTWGSLKCSSGLRCCARTGV